MTNSFFTTYFALALVVIVFLLLAYSLWSGNKLNYGLKLLKYKKDMDVLQDKNDEYVEERKVLIREIFHRVNNNLQVISSLLHILIRNSEDKKIAFDPNDLLDRLKSIGELQNLISGNGEINKLKINEYLNSLLKGVLVTKQRFNEQIEVEIHEGRIDLAIDDLVPLSMILHELVMYCVLKTHTASDLKSIELRFEEDRNLIFMNFSVAGNFNKSKNDSLEDLLIEIFTEQLNGTYSVEQNNERLHYYFKFNKSQPGIKD